jgi:hypothetical protein
MPFKVVYGRDPPAMRLYSPGEARLPTVHIQMMERAEFLLEVREQLEQVQQHHKAFYDRHHRPLEFTVGQWVWLHLLHRPMASLDVRGRGKLGPKYYGPYKIMERIGEVAYRLQLPAVAKIHDVFHVGLLKAFHDSPPTAPAPLPPLRHRRVCLEPAVVLKCQLARGQQEVLVQWKGKPAAETSWMSVDDFQQVYPVFQLEDELLAQVGRDVMVGNTYSRHRNRQAEKHGMTPGGTGGALG